MPPGIQIPIAHPLSQPQPPLAAPHLPHAPPHALHATNPAFAAAMVAAAAAAQVPQSSMPMPMHPHFPFLFTPTDPSLNVMTMMPPAPPPSALTTPPAATAAAPVVPGAPAVSAATACAPVGQASRPAADGSSDRKASRYWTHDEHQRFLTAVAACGAKNYSQISEFVGTRNARQVRTHAQKFQQKLQREESKRKGTGVASVTDASLAAQAAATVAATAAAMSGGGAAATAVPTIPNLGNAAAAAQAHLQAQAQLVAAGLPKGLQGAVKTAPSLQGGGAPSRATDGASSTSSALTDVRTVVGNHSERQAQANDLTSAAAAAAAAVAAEAAALGRGILPLQGIVPQTPQEPLAKHPTVAGTSSAPARAPKVSARAPGAPVRIAKAAATSGRTGGVGVARQVAKAAVDLARAPAAVPVAAKGVGSVSSGKELGKVRTVSATAASKAVVGAKNLTSKSFPVAKKSAVGRLGTMVAKAGTAAGKVNTGAGKPSGVVKPSGVAKSSGTLKTGAVLKPGVVVKPKTVLKSGTNVVKSGVLGAKASALAGGKSSSLPSKSNTTAGKSSVLTNKQGIATKSGVVGSVSLKSGGVSSRLHSTAPKPVVGAKTGVAISKKSVGNDSLRRMASATTVGMTKRPVISQKNGVKKIMGTKGDGKGPVVNGIGTKSRSKAITVAKHNIVRTSIGNSQRETVNGKASAAAVSGTTAPKIAAVVKKNMAETDQNQSTKSDVKVVASNTGKGDGVKSGMKKPKVTDDKEKGDDGSTMAVNSSGPAQEKRKAREKEKGKVHIAGTLSKGELGNCGSQSGDMEIKGCDATGENIAVVVAGGNVEDGDGSGDGGDGGLIQLDDESEHMAMTNPNEILITIETRDVLGDVDMSDVEKAGEDNGAESIEGGGGDVVMAGDHEEGQGVDRVNDENENRKRSLQNAGGNNGGDANDEGKSNLKRRKLDVDGAQETITVE